MKKLKERIKDWLRRKLFPELKTNMEIQNDIQHFHNVIHMLLDQNNHLLQHNMLALEDPVKIFIVNSKRCYQSGRRAGNTTRLVDYAIQFFFLYGEMKSKWFIREPHDAARQRVMGIFRKRLYSEHNFKYIEKSLLINSNNHIKINLNAV